MKIKNMKVNDLIPYENNPRNNEGAIEYVANSIKQFGFKVPIVIDKDNVIVAGHTRWLAAQALGMDEVPVVVAYDLSPAQVKAFRLADNKVAEMAHWDFAKLDVELDGIDMDIDMSDFGFNINDSTEIFSFDNYGDHAERAGNLAKNYIVSPFSVLDARQGYWQERKRYWLELTGDLSETRDGEYGKLGEDGMLDTINEGTSNFDPVLAEVMYKWFNIEGGHILDPFGGEQTKGVVAGELGYKYSGCEIRADQVKLNASCTEKYPNVKYYCGDSNEISTIIKGRGFDMCFTSPPYYDLEVYSKDDMSALGTYEEFMAMYKNIFTQCYEMLAEDTFLVIKVGEIRDKKTGIYRSFVPDNVKMFTDIGFIYYNEIILVTAIGTAPFRANRMMSTRKVVKTHQNVLVFYKGDVKNIPNKFPKLNFEEAEEAGDADIDETEE